MKNDNRLFGIAACYIDGRVLDVGCGSCDFSSFIDGEYFGVDIEENNKENVYRCDVERDRLPFDDNFFDSVVALEVLEHLLDYRNIFEEIRQVLHHGGIFVTSVPNCYNLYKIKREFLGQKYETNEHVVAFHRYVLRQLLEKGGFTVELVDDVVGKVSGMYLLAVTRNQKIL